MGTLACLTHACLEPRIRKRPAVVSCCGVCDCPSRRAAWSCQPIHSHTEREFRCTMLSHNGYASTSLGAPKNERALLRIAVDWCSQPNRLKSYGREERVLRNDAVEELARLRKELREERLLDVVSEQPRGRYCLLSSAWRMLVAGLGLRSH
eukprot:scaffold104651_cov63-Phaeocystis_antarctica.AAC.1